MKINIIVVALSIIGIAPFSAVAGRPCFLDSIDKCESLWRDGKYEQLLEWVVEIERDNPSYLPAKVFSAWRYDQFGCQFEDEAFALRRITNQVQRIICEVNPEFSPRIGRMADDADEMAVLCVKIGQDKNYRQKNFNPLTAADDKSPGPYWQPFFIDVPFLVPDVSLDDTQRTSAFNGLERPRQKQIDWLTLGKAVFGTHDSWLIKREMLNDYVLGILSNSRVIGLIEKLGDDYVQLNGYYALSILRTRSQEAMPELKKYIEREDLSYGADEGKRMAVWALLQFAHDDPEVAEYLRQLPSKIDKRHYKTFEYLKMAIKHLDDGCNRHFLEKYVGGSKNAEESKTLDRELERKN